jgi:hypothetical protein
MYETALLWGCLGADGLCELTVGGHTRQKGLHGVTESYDYGSHV